MELIWSDEHNWPQIGSTPLQSLTADRAVGTDGTVFTCTPDGRGWTEAPAAPARPMMCEKRPYPGAGYWCLEDQGHDQHRLVNDGGTCAYCGQDVTGREPQDACPANQDGDTMHATVRAVPPTPHSDLTLLWNDKGQLVNLDGSTV